MSIPEDWQPHYSEDETRRLTDFYNGKEHMLNDEKKAQLKEHAEAYNIPYYTGDFSLLDAIGQAGAGFVEGFTTFNIADHPDNEYEAVFRRLGHLIGFAPGILGGPAKFLFPKSLAARQFAVAASKVKSLPMLGAEALKKTAKQVVKTSTKGFVAKGGATTAAKEFLTEGPVAHMLDGAFTLGAASGLASWRGSIDEIMHSTASGAVAGAAFRLMGNMTPGTKVHDTIAKGIAGSLFMGIPATVRGDSTPEQVYEYVMGAYFGGNEISWSRAGAHKFVKKMAKKRQADPKWAAKSFMDPEMDPDFQKLPEPVKPLVIEEAAKAFGTPDEIRGGYIARAIAEELGLEGQMKEADLLTAGFEETGEYKDGDKVFKLNEKIAKAKFQRFVASGGAGEADTEFAKWANKVGIPAIHYTFSKHQGKVKAIGYKRILPQSVLEDADSHVVDARNALGLHEPSKGGSSKIDYIKNLHRRNWYQIKWANAVYAVGKFAKKETRQLPDGTKVFVGNRTHVDGGTGIGVQMAINSNKPVYFFDMPSNRWYQHNPTINNQKGAFQAIKTPPKPPERFAGIGSRNLSENGKKAIEELFKTHWKVGETATDRIEAVTKETAEEKRIQVISEELEALDNKYKEINDVMVLQKAAGEDITSYEAELADISAQSNVLADKYNRLTNINTFAGKLLPGETLQDVDADVKTATTNDFEAPSEMEVGKRSLQFVTKHLNELQSGEITFAAGRLQQLELGQLVSSMLTEGVKEGKPRYMRPGKLENLSEEWANDFETEVQSRIDPKFELSKAARREMRQWMTRKNAGKLVHHLQSDGKTIRFMPNKDNPVSMAGARKRQEEPVTRLEEVFEELGGSTEKDPALVVLDHITIDDKNGRRDVKLSEYRDSYLKNELRDEFEAKLTYDNFIGNAMRKMKKEGYYYFGGGGDKDRVYWMKFNPGVEALSSPQQAREFIRIKNLVLKKHSSFKEDFLNSEEDFLLTYNGDKEAMKELHRKSFLSNIMYDLYMNGMEYTDANIKALLTEPGFIKNSVAHNKRMQIWMSNGWKGDAKFIANELAKEGLSLNANGGYNYVIVRDLTKAAEQLDARDISRLNIELPENVDGAIIVHDAVIKAINADAGLPSSGQNKSFIIAPHPTRGALLGKYLLHAAGPEMSKAMEGSGLHMIMQETAVKQRGMREITDYTIVRSTPAEGPKIALESGGKIYSDVGPEHFKYNFGVYGSEHNLQKQLVAKQLMQAMVEHTYAGTDKKVIDDMFDSIIGERWRGEDDVNLIVDNYLDYTKTGDYNAETLRKMEGQIIENIDKVGIPKLVEAMQAESSNRLSEAIYNKILKLNKNESFDEFSNGEMTEEDLIEYNSDIAEFNTMADRVLGSANKWVQKQRENGVDVDIAGMYMHKFIRDFRIKAVQNFLIKSATRPKMNNSISALMRPYDKSMRMNLDKANKLLDVNNPNGINYKDDIFFLDNKFKETIIKLDFKKPYIKLGKLWERYEQGYYKGADKDYVEELFRAVTVRVPMDSMSGAQVLNFKGFTGRDGHGILIHGRAMRAEGGADLDGDKSFIYFGGKGGMKAEWKDAYQSAKEEYYVTDKATGITIVSDNKQDIIPVGPNKGKAYNEVLAFNPSPEERAYLESKASQYSPTQRIGISEAAVKGRNQLAPTASQKQLMIATYNAMRAEDGTDTIYIKLKDKGGEKSSKPTYTTYEVQVKAKTGTENENFQRAMARAQIGLASDPLDELGLTGQDAWFREMWNAHFEITSAKKKKTKKSRNYDVKVSEKFIKDNLNSNELPDYALKKGIYKNLSDINKAYWGKNYNTGRKFNMSEIIDLGDSIRNLTDKASESSFLAKTGQMLHGLDWSDSVFGKIDMVSLDNIYRGYEANVEQYDWMKKFLTRTSMRVTPNGTVQAVNTYRLWQHHYLTKAVNDEVLFKKIIAGTEYKSDFRLNPLKYLPGPQKYSNSSVLENARLARRDLLLKMVAEAEDFVINDVTDMSSISTITRTVDAMVKARDMGMINPKEGMNIYDVVSGIHAKVDALKKKSWLMAKQRGRTDIMDMSLEWKDKTDGEAFWELAKEIAIKDFGMKDTQTKKRGVGDDITAFMDQAQIDIEINRYKLGLTDGGKALFDQLMLGSINRGNLEKIQRFMDSVKKWDPHTLSVIRGFRNEAARTSMSRLGFNSTAIGDKAIETHIGAFMETFKGSEALPDKATIGKFADDLLNTKDPVTEEDVDQGLVTAFLPSGLSGLKKGKIDPEMQSVVGEIVGMLKSYNNKIAQSVPELVRSVIKKDLNAMDKSDFIVFRNWLQDMKRGSFIQRMFSPKGKPLPLAKRHWLLFPKAINRELMRDDIILMRQKGYFTDRTGASVEGMITRPTHYIDILQNFIGKMADSSVNVSDSFIKEFHDKMRFHTGVEDTRAFWEMAVRLRETHHEEITRIRNSDLEPKVKIMAEKELFRVLHETERKWNWKEMKDKNYMLSVDGARKSMTGKEIVDRINGELSSTFEKLHRFITGAPDAIEAYRVKSAKVGPEYNYKLFVKHLGEHLSGTSGRWKKEGIVDIPSHFGIDGLRKIAHSMQLDMMPEAARSKIELPTATGNLRQAYFPHMFFDKAKSKKLAKEAMTDIMNTPNKVMDKEAKALAIKRIVYKNKSLGGDWYFEDMEGWDVYDSVMEDVSKNIKLSDTQIKTLDANRRIGSMKSRETHMGGWSIDPVVVEEYIRALSKTYHRQLSQLYSRIKISEMGQKMYHKWGEGQRDAWQNFAKIYVRDAMGNPSVVSEEMINNPNMALKGTPYSWWADNKVKDKINKVGKMLGLTNKDLPEDMQGIDATTLQAWSNLEAKYEMATLLAHPKSSIANIFGGTMHTIQSVGLRRWINARRPEHLVKINPRFKTLKDVEDFTISQGVFPEFLVYELGLQKEFRNAKGEGFLKDLSLKMARDPEMSETTFRDLASKHGILDSVVNKAAKFMTIPEKALRRDAFMAHYLMAWEKFGDAVKDYDHPYLIELAKKGVKATQFLYSAPYRPAFARTALGKVMTRFQLWAWNSVRFRNDVRREARIYGLTPGTEEWKRFERTAQIDMFVYALANTFNYSLFESNLPQPWGWWQDTSEWIFGDEQERDRAFYGAWPKEVAPLQIVTPPGLRMVGPVFSAVLNDDWSRIAEYYVYTMLPFGRIARDVNPYAKGNIIRGPSRIVEKLSGIPIGQLQRAATKRVNEGPGEVIFAKGPLDFDE